MIRHAFLALTPVTLALTGCATARDTALPTASIPTAQPADPTPATLVRDREAVERLLANKGITLQWIGWNERGTAHARWDGDRLLLTGAQAKSGGGRLFLDGYVTAINASDFTFRGTIRIEDTPDAGRRCEMTKDWQFAVTQNRPYWRLREFEWCDRLTDYIDIYF